LKTTISNTTLTATINHKGAELISLKNQTSDREYIWGGNPEYWGKHAPVLFPIVGTLKNNSYIFNDTSYKLSRHGFARDMVFELIKETEYEAVFSLKADEITKEWYPFDFELHLTYTLMESELTIRYNVMNNGSHAMYFSIGGHPAFALPNQFERYSLKFEPNEKLISYPLENDLISNATKEIDLIQSSVPLTYSLFENDALIFKELQSNQIQLLENNTPILNFKFRDFPNFGIWTKIDAPFICLEPWAGYSDVRATSGKIAKKEGIQKLDSNISKEYSFSIEIL